MHLASPKPAQTLLEAVLAIGVILVATISATTLIVTTISAGQSSEDKIVAANLAREGIEVVRGRRDSNWMKRDQNMPGPNGEVTYAWDTNLTANDYLAKFSLTSGWILQTTAPGDSRNAISQAKATSGAYEYLTQNCVTSPSLTCTPTKFQRLITISTPSDDTFFGVGATYLLATSTVTWNNHGDKTYTASERLYDWR